MEKFQFKASVETQIHIFPATTQSKKQYFTTKNKIKSNSKSKVPEIYVLEEHKLLNCQEILGPIIIINK